jgi:chemosensory pili system protein ChpA (sensor histidine kinase/response regulator)
VAAGAENIVNEPRSEVASQTLEAVAREISVALGEARVALEAHVEQPDNPQLLQRCETELAQVQGVLRMLEIHGAALLAEEMRQVALYLQAGAERKNQAEALDALMRAMVQLPSYLERVLAGGRDLALVLLPLLNDLRAVRGSALLSEGTLLLLNLKSDRQAAPVPPAAGEEPLTVGQWARKLRARFQVGLIGWIRGERVDQNLDILSNVALRLEQVATTQPVFQLWWVTGAVIESLRERGLDGGVSVKRLLGLADREIKRLYEEGEQRYGQKPPVELLNNLLYYVARATKAGPRTAAVRASFRLGDLLPVDESIEQERENLSAPSVKLMQTVAAAIREDLAKIKDVLDIFVRRGGAAPEELVPQLDLLRKIGDTLGVLGLGEQRARVQGEIARLEQLIAAKVPPPDSALVDIAATLIRVEDHLDDELVGLILPRRVDPTQPAVDLDFQLVQSAVLRECVVNLARVKEYVAQNVGGTLDAAGFDNWFELMRGIQAGLLMLGKSRAVQCIDRVTTHLRAVMQPGGAGLATEALDRLADAIVSVEYYMETLQAGRADPWYMLDNADAALLAVDAIPGRTVPTVAPSQGSYTRTMVLDVPPGADGSRPTPSPPVLAAAPPPPVEADPELLSLFLEEAGEEVTRIEQHLPVWDQNPLDEEALSVSRRAFHTLKGSGRMVGARDLSEFAWAIENLINRLIDKTLTRSPAVLGVLRDSLRVLPELVLHLGGGPAPTADVLGIGTRAHALAAGRTADSVVVPLMRVAAAAPALAPIPESAGFAAPKPVATDSPSNTSTLDVDLSEMLLLPESPPADSDITLRDIYARETDSHVAVVRDWLQRQAGLGGLAVLPEPVYRACHTLAGSSKMAEARHGIRLAEPLNHWLRKAFDSGIGLTTGDLSLLADCMGAMESVSRNLDEDTGFFHANESLRDRIHVAEGELDRRILESERPDDYAAEYTAPESQPEPVQSDVDTAPALPVLEPQTAFAPPEAPPPEPPPELPPVIAPPPAADYDPEIAAIFADEATELLEAAQHGLARVEAEGASPAALAELKRPLHTLKGGARMAGVVALGDLAHEFETWITHVELGLVPAGAETQSTAQAALDELARMCERIVAGQPVLPAEGLLQRLRGGAVEPVMAEQPAADAVPAEVVPELQPEPEPEPLPPPVELEPAAESDAALLDFNAAFDAAPSEIATDAVLTVFEAAPLDLAPPLYAPPEPVALPAQALASAADVAATGTHPALSAALLPPGREPTVPGERAEMARVDADLLNQLLNHAGEVSIGRSRVEQQLGSVEFNLGELSRTVIRLKEQLRKLEIETETQILHRHESEGAHRGDFDPLELDRYSSIQQFSRALAETANDVASIQQLLETLTRDTQNLLQQQGRTITELQNGLMRTRMVSFQRHVQRLARIVRQAASDTGKQAELLVEGASGELDRQVLERMLPPFEHMLRNAVAHGIESPEQRRAVGKSEIGQVRLHLKREGAEVIIEIGDDGEGMNLPAIRAKGLALGLIRPEQQLSDEAIMQLVLEPGFSTATSLTQAAGRGIGMDVVATEVKKLGGSLNMETTPGQGSRFTIRLPFTLAVSHALVVRVGDEFYALPLPTVEGVVRLPRADIQGQLSGAAAPYVYGGQKYRFQHLGLYVGLEPGPLPELDQTLPVVLVRAGEHSTALVIEELIGSREIVVKPVGPQISSIRGISGATILGDGRIVVILDIGALVRAEWRGLPTWSVPREKSDRRIVALVVDDSITVRRVTQRLLERNGMRVLTARDGLDAMAVMQESVPDVLLLDIEMPRMDGYEVAAQVRGDPRLQHVPIIMITSRAGEKHRARAIELGVDDYLGKPYQESQLLDAIAPLVADRAGADLHG